jgi:hypothetical protein
MRKINLAVATITLKTPEGKKERPYDIKDSMADVLLHPELKLTGVALLKNNKLADKILSSTEDSVLLEEAEYQILRGACERIQGFSRDDLELVKRILEAPEVEVEVK